MQLSVSSPTIRSAGLIERAQSRVNMTAVAFKVLSSSLYSDKIGAVLREIGCNAADAHVQAGTPDLPFEVHLPGVLSPTFSIKDFGPGLSHDEVMNNYQTYFHSTKTDSNDVTGCFGLGSKSPYAYSNQFTVRSAQNGVMRTYFCAFDEAGVPTTSLVSTSPAPDDWPHGVEVSLPVSFADCYSFSEKAQSIFRWFRVPPKLLGGSELRPVTYAWKVGRFWKSNESIYDPCVIMGNVAYRLDIHAALAGADLSDVAGWIYNNDIILSVPIGTVDITASRESLEYTKRTVDNLTAIVKGELDQLVQRINTVFDNAPPLTTGTIDAIVAEITEGGDQQAVAGLVNYLRKHIKPEHKAAFEVLGSGQVPLDGWYEFRRKYDDDTAPSGTLFYWDGTRRRSCAAPLCVKTGGVVSVFINDRPPRAMDRVRYYMDQHPSKSVLVFTSPTASGLKELGEYFARLGVPVDYEMVSSLPKPPPKQRGASTVTRAKPHERTVNVWTTGLGSTGFQLYEPPTARICDIPLESRYVLTRYCAGWGGRYVDVPGSGRHRTPRAVYEALVELWRANFDTPSHLVVTTESESDKLIASHGFKPLRSWRDDVLAKDQRTIDFLAQAKLELSVNLSACPDRLTHELFLLAVNKDRKWDAIAKALQGTTYLTEIETLAARYWADRQRAKDLKVVVPYGGALETFGFKPQQRYETTDYTSQARNLHSRYKRLEALRPQIIFEAGTFDFQMRALAAAVTLDAPDTVPTVTEENG